MYQLTHTNRDPRVFERSAPATLLLKPDRRKVSWLTLVELAYANLRTV
jgi:hypothetical protein